MSGLWKIFEAWRRRRMDRAVRRYAADALAPKLGLPPDALDAAPLRDKRHRRLYIVSTPRGKTVLRFAFGRRAGYAETFALAHAAFEKAGVAVGRMLFCDAAAQTRRRFGLACVAQEFLEGEFFDSARHAFALPQLALTLAAAHRDLAPSLGRLARPRQIAAWEGLLVPMIKRRLDRLHASRTRQSRAMAGDIQNVLASLLREGPGLNWARFSLLHGDLTPGNAIVLPDGRVGLIDFDRAMRGPFGIELAAVPFLFTLTDDDRRRLDSIAAVREATRDRARVFFENYFSKSPAPFRAEWEVHEAFYLSWIVLMRARDLPAAHRLIVQSRAR